MKHAPTPRSGFSLIELIVVLAIVAALAIAGVYTMGGRPNAAVRSTLDEIEGTIMGAQKLASATGKDVYLVADGVWDPKAANYFILAYDIVKPADIATNPTNPSLWPAAARTRIIANARTPLGNTNDPAGVFQLTFNPTSKSLVRDQLYSGVVIGASAWKTTALGGVTDLPSTTVGITPTFAPALTSANQLCKGATNFVTVSGMNKRFINDFHIAVVGTRSLNAMPGSAVGYVVVPANSGTTYKFINSGKGVDKQWRRL